MAFFPERYADAYRLEMQAFVDAVAHGLADKVVGTGEAVGAVIGEELPLVFEVFRIGGGIDVEVVAPAGKFETVVPHRLGEGGKLF